MNARKNIVERASVPASLFSLDESRGRGRPLHQQRGFFQSFEPHADVNPRLAPGAMSLSRLQRFALISILFFSTVLSADEALLTKAFVVKFRKVDEVASMVNPLLSEKGAVTIQPGLRTVIVQDYEENLRQIEMAISSFDIAPPSAEITIKLIRATRSPVETPISEEVKSMARLGDVFKFNHYQLLDIGSVQCQEGQPSMLSLAGEYQVSFTPDVIQDGDGVIRLKTFQLRKRKQVTPGRGPFVPLLSLTINLRNAETLVLGATRFEASDQALLVILSGKVKR